jgi:hypothetical protein
MAWCKSLFSPERDAQVTVHKQFLRYLMATHARLSLRELTAYLQKTTANVADRDKVRPVYDMLLDRVGQRLNDQNVPLLFDYLGIRRADSQEEEAVMPSSPHESDAIEPNKVQLPDSGAPSLPHEETTK